MVDEKNGRNDSQGLQKLIQTELELEETDYPQAKEVLNARADNRGKMREFADRKVSLPADSKVYVGIKITNGRINYREVAEALKETCGIDDSTYSDLLRAHRTPGKRLVYGRTDSEKYLRFWQEDFEFLTPEKD